MTFFSICNYDVSLYFLLKFENNLTSFCNLYTGKAFDITYIRLIFHSPRPESFSIWKKTTDTSDWEPYQYYSASCLSTFNVPQDVRLYLLSVNF